MLRQDCFSACLVVTTEVYAIWAEKSVFNARGIVPRIGPAASCWGKDTGVVDATITSNIDDVDECEYLCRQKLECVAFSFSFNPTTTACRIYDVKPSCDSETQIVQQSAALCTGDTERLTRGRPIFTVDVVNGAIVYGGPAALDMAVVKRGNPSIIAGPTGEIDGIAFAGLNDALLLGSDGIEVSGVWSIDVWFSLTTPTQSYRNTNQHVLVSGKTDSDKVHMPKTSNDVAVNGKNAGIRLDSLSAGWHRMTVVSEGTSTKFYIDAEPVQNVERVLSSQIYSIGNYKDMNMPFGPMAQFRLYDYALTADEVFGLREIQPGEVCYYDRAPDDQVTHPSYEVSAPIEDWLYNSCCDLNRNVSPNLCDFHVGANGRNKDGSDEDQQASVNFFCDTLGGVSDGELTSSMSGCPPYAAGYHGCDSSTQCAGVSSSGGTQINGGYCKDDKCTVSCNENYPCPGGSTSGDYKYHWCEKHTQCEDDAYCSGHTCHLKKDRGEHCSTKEHCLTDYCSNNEVSSAAKGKCADQCSSNEKCAANDNQVHYCSNNGQCKLNNQGGLAMCDDTSGGDYMCHSLILDGQPCAGNNDNNGCSSGYCDTSDDICRTRCSTNDKCTPTNAAVRLHFCNAQDQCGSGGFCESGGGQCKIKKAIGESCNGYGWSGGDADKVCSSDKCTGDPPNRICKMECSSTNKCTSPSPNANFYCSHPDHCRNGFCNNQGLCSALKAIGDQSSSAEQCSSGSSQGSNSFDGQRCVNMCSNAAKCTPGSAYNKCTCSNAQCTACKNGYCHQNMCKALTNNGGSCSDSANCASDFCTGRKCRHQCTNRSPCNANGGANNWCDDDDDCRNGRCTNNVCLSLIAIGSTCGVNGDCVADRCESLPAFSGKKCINVCSGTNSCSGTSLYNKCTVDAHCRNGYCDRNRCYPLGAVGVSCDNDGECTTNWCQTSSSYSGKRCATRCGVSPRRCGFTSVYNRCTDGSHCNTGGNCLANMCKVSVKQSLPLTSRYLSLWFNTKSARHYPPGIQRHRRILHTRRRMLFERVHL